MCFDICTINIRVSIRVRGLHLVLYYFLWSISLPILHIYKFIVNLGSVNLHDSQLINSDHFCFRTPSELFSLGRSFELLLQALGNDRDRVGDAIYGVLTSALLAVKEPRDIPDTPQGFPRFSGCHGWWVVCQKPARRAYETNGKALKERPCVLFLCAVEWKQYMKHSETMLYRPEVVPMGDDSETNRLRFPVKVSWHVYWVYCTCLGRKISSLQGQSCLWPFSMAFECLATRAKIPKSWGSCWDHGF